MPIPKKIHWCWLSGEPLPKEFQKCVDSWKRVMPDYEIVLWDTNRFDIHSVKFVEDAYNARKWAFAADYIRLYALYTEGGIYLDSDVRVFRRFDEFLRHSAFSSVEYNPGIIHLRNEKNPHTGYAIQAAIIGAEKGNAFIRSCMEYYHITPFRICKDALDPGIAPYVMARAAEQYGFKYDQDIRKPQVLPGDIVIYPPSVFATAYQCANMRSYALHCCAAAWVDFSPRVLFLLKIQQYLCHNYRFFAMLHYRRKQWTRTIKKLF